MGTEAPPELAGAALDERVRELAIEGASSMSADEKRAAVADAEAAIEKSGQVTLRTAYPVDRFDHGLEGVPPITSAGTIVPADRVDELRALAKTADTKLERA